MFGVKLRRNRLIQATTHAGFCSEWTRELVAKICRVEQATL